ncbi:MAG TPA: hypothetical protein VI424_20095 [Terriglobales bacterium]
MQITVAESLGVEERGAYYEESGALRDMVQNHLMQLLSLVAMEPPASFAARDVRAEKAKAVCSIRPLNAGAVWLAQVSRIGVRIPHAASTASRWANKVGSPNMQSSRRRS